MNYPQDNKTPLNAPASGATPEAPSGKSTDSETKSKQPADTSEAPVPAQGAAPVPTQRVAPVPTQSVAPVPTQSVAPVPTQGEAQGPAPAATPPVNQDVGSLKQAAQLEHKPSADGVPNPSGSDDCALAGGRRPQTPELISKVKPVKKSKPKKRDNHVSIRLTDEEWDVLEKLMNSTGMTLSESLRAIILAFASKSGSVYLRPKSPPAQLEKLLGELSMWRKDLNKAKPRLNIPTPANDKERHAEVTRWREESDRLLRAIPLLEELVKLALGVMTSLTPERVYHIRKNYTTLETWKTTREKDGKLGLVPFLQALIDLLVDAGIKPPQKK